MKPPDMKNESQHLSASIGVLYVQHTFIMSINDTKQQIATSISFSFLWALMCTHMNLMWKLLTVTNTCDFYSISWSASINHFIVCVQCDGVRGFSLRNSIRRFLHLDHLWNMWHCKSKQYRIQQIGYQEMRVSM